MASSTAESDWVSCLLCRVGTRLCALPLDAVMETMRPLAIEPLARAPCFVRGLSVIRGAPVPVVDACRLFGEREGEPGRLVAMGFGGRRIGLLVESVLGLRAIAVGSLEALPPLLQDAAGDAVETLGTLDGELLFVLRTARIIPDALVEDFDADRAGP